MNFSIFARYTIRVIAVPALLILPIASCSSHGSQVPDSIGTHIFTPVEIPSKLSFAGEEVPLEYYDVRENMDRELLSTIYFHSQTIRYIKNAPRYFSIIEPILKSYGIPEDFKYLCVAESGFNERAVSPAKAVGLWQILEGTAKDAGLEVNDEVDERYHIEKSTEVACRIFKSNYQKFGSWALVAAAYNSGRNFIDRQLTTQKVKSYYDMQFGEETTRYVFRILSFKLVLENPEKYGFYIPKDQYYPIIKTKTVEVNGPVTDWPAFALDNGINYKALKMFNPWIREPFLKNPTRKTYKIKIPEKGYRTRD